MSQEVFPPQLQAMIDRVAILTVDETDALGKLWESDEELIMPNPSFALEIEGAVNAPVVTNEGLIGAWQPALEASGAAGRVEQLDAAIAAGRAAAHEIRHLHDSPSSKNGTEQAVRAAVLGVGARDLISDDDYQTLVRPWQQVLGTL